MQKMTQIILIILFSIQVLIFFASTLFLLKNRMTYPIKQLSPILTLLISISILFSCTILFVIGLNHSNISHSNLWNNIYVFLRQFLIVTFYLRCFRICFIYFDFQHKIIQKIFSSELILAIISLIISLPIPFVQYYQQQRLTVQKTQFFLFINSQGYVTYKTFLLWAFNNLIFFVILFMSLRVNKKFKFLFCLVFTYLLHHIETWYILVKGFANQPLCQNLNYNFQFVPIIILICTFLVILSPYIKTQQYQHPLPNELILADHNMLFLCKQAYLILSKFSTYLQKKSVSLDQRRRFSSKYLQIYTQFKILKKQMTLDTLQNQNQQSSTLLKNYVQKYILPNLQELQILKGSIIKLFESDDFLEVRNDLTIKDFRDLDGKLTQNVQYMYKQWKKTSSRKILQQQLTKNNKVINRMQKLNINL